VMRLAKPVVRVRYDLVELDPPLLRRKVQHVIEQREPATAAEASGVGAPG